MTYNLTTALSELKAKEDAAIGAKAAQQAKNRQQISALHNACDGDNDTALLGYTFDLTPNDQLSISWHGKPVGAWRHENGLFRYCPNGHVADVHAVPSIEIAIDETAQLVSNTPANSNAQRQAQIRRII
jgi:hypothetical protein